ncbi:MAG TPA: DUF1080 domain-containing protein [Vicinamibacterales bacterium]|nr:DUF1080 domain-containing protein [Vicinamibacterales bacterium]
MVRYSFVAGIAVVLLVWSSPLFGQALNSLTPQEMAQGWQLVFDGKTLTGWHSSVPAPPSAGAPPAAPAVPPPPGALQAIGSNPSACTTAQRGAAATVPPGASHWEVVNGVLRPCGEPTGYLTSDQSYRNFVLSIEFKTGADTNSGVYIRSPKETGGYEVNIWRQQPAGYHTGSIVATAKTAKDYSYKPDQWNHYQITADGDRLVIVLNGETTLDIRDAKFPEGHIRLQYQQWPIEFRNIKIRPLP